CGWASSTWRSRLGNLFRSMRTVSLNRSSSSFRSNARLRGLNDCDNPPGVMQCPDWASVICAAIGSRRWTAVCWASGAAVGGRLQPLLCASPFPLTAIGEPASQNQQKHADGDATTCGVDKQQREALDADSVPIVETEANLVHCQGAQGAVL